MTPNEHYQAGQLTEAIQAATDAVKKQPTNIDARGFLCELLCFAGELERADTQLDSIGLQRPEAMVGVALFRQLVRAEKSRHEFHTAGRVPEFLQEPPDYLRKHLEAAICLREGKPVEAVALLDQAEQERPKLQGVCNGEPFDDFRDLDDLTASFFEVLTSNGKFYWIPFESVLLVEFPKPERPQDLLWRRTHMVVHNGPDGDVYLPAVYCGTHKLSDDQLRLGRATDWQAEEGAPVRGLGQRVYLAGETDRPVLELSKITFTQPDSA